MWKEYYYCIQGRKVKRVQAFLDDFEFEYEREEDFLTFWIEDNQEAFKRFKRKFPFMIANSSQPVYSKEELETAKWLIVSTASLKVILENLENTFSYRCEYKRLFSKESSYRHSEQTDNFEAKKGVKWGNQHYFYGSDMYAIRELFCSDIAKRILLRNWKGISFRPVKKYNKDAYIDNLNQICFEQILPIEAIQLQGKERMKKCPDCGKISYKIDGVFYQLSLKKEYLADENSFYSTGNIWNSGLMHEYPMYIVPASFYKKCRELGMDRNLYYVPVNVI